MKRSTRSIQNSDVLLTICDNAASLTKAVTSYGSVHDIERTVPALVAGCKAVQYKDKNHQVIVSQFTFLVIMLNVVF